MSKLDLQEVNLKLTRGADGMWHISCKEEPDLQLSPKASMSDALRHVSTALNSAAVRRRNTIAKDRHNDHLLTVLKKFSADYKPYGMRERGPNDRDCEGCQYRYGLETKSREKLYHVWSVCGNPKSHRCGLLTHEGQGCPHGVYKQVERVFNGSPHPVEVPSEPSEQIPTAKAS